MSSLIRDVKLTDAKAILDIYAKYILETTITFEIEVPSLESFTTRIKTISEKFPYIVYEEDGKIIGYAYVTKFKERAAYNHSVECTVYIDSEHTGKGIGQKLYTELFSLTKQRGFRNVYAYITLPNPNSLKIHEKFGFHEVGVYKNVGFKFNNLIDVICLELLLIKDLHLPN